MEDPREFMLVELYRDQEAITAHIETDYFKEYVIGRALPDLKTRQRGSYIRSLRADALDGQLKIKRIGFNRARRHESADADTSLVRAIFEVVHLQPAPPRVEIVY